MGSCNAKKKKPEKEGQAETSPAGTTVRQVAPEPESMSSPTKKEEESAAAMQPATDEPTVAGESAEAAAAEPAAAEPAAAEPAVAKPAPDAIQVSSAAEAAFAAAAEEPPEITAEACMRIRGEVGETMVRVCILGGQSFHNPASEGDTKAIAKELASVLDGKACYITGGMKGVQKTFAEHCGDGSRVWNLVPIGTDSGFAQGTDIHGGEDLAHRKEIFSEIGDLFIAIEGGPGVAKESQRAAERGATVLPVIRCGGAGSGLFDFPQSAFERPHFATEAQWEVLADKEASAEAVGAVVAELVVAYASGREEWTNMMDDLGDSSLAALAAEIEPAPEQPFASVEATADADAS